MSVVINSEFECLVIFNLEYLEKYIMPRAHIKCIE